MDLSQLRLKRVVIANFKSVKQLELNNLPSMVLFMGRNNAGKSNILDSFKFISDASFGLEKALASRGGKLSEVILFKNEEKEIEFVFEFVLSYSKRAEMLARLFMENKSVSPEQAAASNLLSSLTLRVVISKEGVSEELLASNWLPESRPTLIFSLKSRRGKNEAFSGGLESLCQEAHSDLPVELRALNASAMADGPLRLRLGRPDCQGDFPISYELAESVYQQFATLESVDPLRRLPSSSPIQGQLMLSPDASNLPDVLHWLYNNKPKLFRKIESDVGKLVPQLGKLYTPTVQNTATLGLIDSQDEDLVFSMDQMSFGTKSLVAIITKVAIAKPGTWLCIEEPETYLHPKAQTGLFQFLRRESVNKRICVATHSTSIAASCPVESLFFIQRDAAHCTTALPVTKANANEVIEQLGVKPSFSFEADVIVFVEDEDAIPIYEFWAKKFGFRIKIQFLDMEGACTLGFFANALVAASKFVHTLVFAVFGKRGGPDGKNNAQQRILEHLDLPENQVLRLESDGVEAFLLDPKAVAKAFPALPLSEAELGAHLDPALAPLDSKKALEELLTEFRAGHYDGKAGARIAEEVGEIPEAIRAFFERIESQTKPFWKI